jgi:predicted amidohydrolase
MQSLSLLAVALAVTVAWLQTAGARSAEPGGGGSVRVAIVQFDAVPAEREHNLDRMQRLVEQAVSRGAGLVMFHELATSDYVDDIEPLAEPIPDGPSCRRMAGLAAALDCHIAFGLPERDGPRRHIAYVFLGPEGLVARYRKTWLFKTDADEGFRNEWARYDPGTGPEAFEILGLRATCLICADADSPRAIERVRRLRPDVIFFPVNRGAKVFETYPRIIARMGATTLVANRVGRSHTRDCVGGSAVYDARGRIVVGANRSGREEILYHDLPPAPRPSSPGGSGSR